MRRQECRRPDSPADAEKPQMQKLSTGPFSASKKSGTKRENPPCTPYKRKARGKEANRDYLRNPAQSRAGAHVRVKEPPRTCTPDVAGLAIRSGSSSGGKNGWNSARNAAPSMTRWPSTGEAVPRQGWRERTTRPWTSAKKSSKRISPNATRRGNAIWRSENSPLLRFSLSR